MTGSEIEGRYDAVWPLAPIQRAAQSAATDRSSDLAGKRIGFVWDYLFFGDRIVDVVRDQIAERYEDVVFVGPEEFGNIHGADEEDVIARLPLVLKRTGVDSVIAAVGA